MKPIKNESVTYQVGDIVQPYAGGCHYKILDLNGTSCSPQINRCRGCLNDGRTARLHCIPLDSEGDYCLSQGKVPWMVITRDK